MGGPHFLGQSQHLAGHGHFEIHARVEHLGQQAHIAGLNMAAVFTQMNRNAIGTGLFLGSGGTISQAGPGGALLAYAAIGVAGSLIVVPLTYLQVFAGIAHVYLVAATLGLWFLQCVVPLIVVRKPGASLIACLAMGVVSAATTPFGVAAIGIALFSTMDAMMKHLVLALGARLLARRRTMN